MGEIDTKPIKPVQVALTFFGEKSDQRKSHSNSSDSENEKEKDFEGLHKDLANYKLQLEAKDFAYKQALLKLEHYRTTADELSTLLKNFEAEREKFIEEGREARVQIDELESKTKEMADQLSDTVKIREQFAHVFNELNDAQGELLCMETELAVARDLRLKVMTRAELIETAAKMDEEKMEELLKHVAELNDAIFMSKLAAIEAEKDKCMILSGKDTEIELMTATVFQAQEQLEAMRKQLEVTNNLENQLMDKSILIDTLQLQLKQANELLSSSEKSNSDFISDLKLLKEDMEVMERKNSDQTFYIEALEMEMNQLKLELKNANEEVSHFNSNIEMLTGELEKVKTEMEEVKERETEAQVEIAVLKSDLHKGRSKLAAAEAAEARAQNVKSGLYLAVQKLAVEAEEAKKENQRLKQGADKIAEEEIEIASLVNPQVENSAQDVRVSQNDESKSEAEERSDDNNSHIMISLEEYESLIRKAKKADQIPKQVAENSDQSETKSELEGLEKELEIAMAKIAEFRTRAEQAVTRADASERAKIALEDQLRMWRQQKQRRKAALAALREESAPKVYNPPAYESTLTTYQPLGKVLNMKF